MRNQNSQAAMENVIVKALMYYVKMTCQKRIDGLEAQCKEATRENYVLKKGIAKLLSKYDQSQTECKQLQRQLRQAEEREIEADRRARNAERDLNENQRLKNENAYLKEQVDMLFR